MKRFAILKLSVMSSFAMLVTTTFAVMPTRAADFPNGSVTILVPYPPGGSADAVTRALAPKLAEIWKQAVVVENRPGASTVIAMGLLARSKPDGQTLGIITPTLTVNATLFPKTPYDPAKDFTPITTIAQNISALAVNPQLDIHNIEELRQYGEKAKELRFASGHSIGTLLGYVFSRQLGIKASEILYNGSSQAAQAVARGEVDYVIDTVPSIRPLADAKRVRVIAVMGSDRISSMPEIPTSNEQNAVWETFTWAGIAGPKGIPPEIVEKINQDVAQALQSPEVRNRIEAVGLKPLHMSSVALRDRIAQEMKLYGDLIRDYNIPINQ